MTVYHSEQIDQLRDLLEDSGDTQFSFAKKRYYLNAGMRAMWPRVHQVVTDSTLQFVDDQYEYTLPAAVRGGHLVLLEKSMASDDDFFYPMDYDDYEIKPGAAGADLIVLKFDPGSTWADGYIRITTCLPLTEYTAADYTAAGSEVYTGPDYTSEGPTLYAMSRLVAVPLDDRLDYGRMSVQAQNRAASPQELIAAGAYWLDEFERRVDEWKLPLPRARY
jgi:hypothetical protein